ncbi:hypothetical protein DLH72_02795 [Candidatus Gracilibacteria bacterium]|nr:MAG: hypothetical protein DLH72_02795 [Candidatus Gracilibacteria bacterium]
MRKRFLIKIGNEEFLILEPTVEQYWLSMYDLESFLFEIFNENIPEITEEQLKKFLNTIFSVEESFEDKIFDFDKKLIDPETSSGGQNDFHLVVARLMKYFGNSYKQIMEIPISVFRNILKDFEKIENKSSTEKKSFSEKESLQELKNLSNL